MLCRFPNNCWIKDCKFDHYKPPHAYNKICRDDTDCKLKYCQWTHPIRDRNKITELESYVKQADDRNTFLDTHISAQDKEISELKARIASLESANKILESRISIEITSGTQKNTVLINKNKDLKSKIVEYEKIFTDIDNVAKSRKRYRSGSSDEDTEVELDTEKVQSIFDLKEGQLFGKK